MRRLARSPRFERRVVLALILAVTVSFPLPAAAADDVYKSLGAKFVTGVHRDSILAAPTQKLSRWTVPVRIAVAGRQMAIWQPLLQEFLVELTKATGHEMVMPSEAPINVAVIFANGFVAESEQVPIFKSLLRNAVLNPTFVAQMAEADRTGLPCFWTLFRNDAGALNSGILMVAERARLRAQKFCVYTWLVGITGISAWNVDMRFIGEHMLDETPDGDVSLSATGWQLLRMLYDPRLRDGMRVDETLPLLRDIVSGLR